MPQSVWENVTVHYINIAKDHCLKTDISDELKRICASGNCCQLSPSIGLYSKLFIYIFLSKCLKLMDIAPLSLIKSQKFK